MTMSDIGEIEIINRLTKKSARKIRKLDEIKLNQLLQTLPNIDLQKLIYKPLESETIKSQKKRVLLKKRHMPIRLKKIVLDLDLLDEPDHEKRLNIFVGYCRYLNYSVNTASKYLTLLKNNGLFGQTDNHLYIDRSEFVDSGKIHTRTFSFESFKKLMVYLHQNFDKYSAPILLACYSGLRTFEILQFSNITLHQLNLKQTSVSIFRKKTFRKIDDTKGDQWRPVYTTHLTNFLNQLTVLYHDEYEAYRKNGIIIKLFNITPKTLCNRLRQIYFVVNGYKLPLGSGIHSLRNMLAMLMAQKTQNIWTIQQFLQHKNVNTTKRYVHADFTHISEEFNRLTNSEFSDLTRDLNVMDKNNKTKL